jgi:hypothetical protein
LTWRHVAEGISESSDLGNLDIAKGAVLASLHIHEKDLPPAYNCHQVNSIGSRVARSNNEGDCELKDLIDPRTVLETVHDVFPFLRKKNTSDQKAANL